MGVWRREVREVRREARMDGLRWEADSMIDLEVSC
jgi:hypothetical protein